MPADTHERLYGITQIRAVTPSDTTDLALNGVYPRAVFIGGTGNLTIVALDDTSAVELTTPALGVWHPMTPKRITAATTATLIRVGY